MSKESNKPKNDREFGQFAGAVYERIYFDKMDIDEFIDWLFNHTAKTYNDGVEDSK